jgi:hypothetical protein
MHLFGREYHYVHERLEIFLNRHPLPQRLIHYLCIVVIKIAVCPCDCLLRDIYSFRDGKEII